MSSLELNKIVASVLVGGLLTLGTGIVANALYQPGHNTGELAALPIAAPDGSGGGGETAAPVDALSLIASADPTAGAKAAKKCMTCHTFEKGGPNKIGPNLWGIVGAAHGHADGFAYSDVIKGMDKPWDFSELDQFISNPKGYAPGTKMAFAGIRKPEERAALLRWLRDQSDSPAELPQ